LLTQVFYFGRQALLAFLIPVVLAILVASIAKPVYVAQSRLLILLGSDYVFSGDASGTGQGLSFDRSQIVHAEMEILGSKDLRVHALEAIGLDRVYPGGHWTGQGINEAAERLDKDLKVENIPQSNVIELSLRNGDPAVAKLLLNKIVDLYVERRREVFGRADAQALAPERADLEARLAKSEAALSAFANAHSIGDYAQELQAVQTQQAALQNELETIDQQLATASARTAVLAGRVRTTQPVVELLTDNGRSQQADDLTKSLLELQKRRREAAAKFQDGYPLVAELDRQIATLKAAIQAAPQAQVNLVRKGANPVYQTLDTEMAIAQSDSAGLASGRKRIEESLRTVNARLAEMMDIGPQYRSLSRDVASIEAALQDITKRAEDASVEASLERSHANVRIVQAAAVDSHGRSGRLPLLAVGVVLGLAAAIATIAVLHALSEVMVSPYDVETKMRLPVIVAASKAAGRTRRREGPIQADYLNDNDAYFIIQLLASLSKKEGGVIELIAASEGEGVTSLAIDLALLVVARTKLTVLVLDIEPRAGRATSTRIVQRGGHLHQASSSGSVLQLANSRAYVSRPIGDDDKRLSEADVLKCLESARAHYDLVIIDAPALETSYTGAGIARRADLVLAVVEAERTRAAVANNLVDRIAASGAEVTGVILNKRRFLIPRAIYAKL
jgi:uncharacterized protein involved in exopolysaccharide biosynthesis